MNTTMPTSLANGRYELGELIGRGGMAEVRVAVDKRCLLYTSPSPRD